MIRIIQWLATAILTLAGFALLCKPAHAAVAGTGFKPTRFTVADSGTVGKPDVILLPGLGSSAAVWNDEAAKLAPSYRLHILQISGFAGAPVAGNTTFPMLPAIVAELHQYIVANNLHPVVVGHSLGGLLTLMLADKYPGDVRKIVMVDSLPSLAALYAPQASAEEVKPFAEGMKAQMLAAAPEAFAAQSKISAAAMVKSPAALQTVTDASLASDRTVFVNAMAEDLETDLRSEVVNIKTPAMLLYPVDASAPGVDPNKVTALYQAQYATMPNLKLVRIDDSRHFIMYDQPTKFDEALQAFLR